MHLSDNEIFDYLNNNKSNDHLERCVLCQERLTNRSDFQNKLNQSYQHNELKMQWNLLEKEYDRNFSRQHKHKMEYKIKKLQLGLFSVAACLCLVILIPLYTSTNLAPPIETELARLIDENHQLQRSVELSSPLGSLQNVAIQTLRIKLQHIDSEIQLGYVEGLTRSEKLKLWQARKQLLINSIKELNAESNKNYKSI